MIINNLLWIIPATKPLQFEKENSYGISFNEIDSMDDIQDIDENKTGLIISTFSGQKEIIQEVIKLKNVEHLQFNNLNINAETFESMVSGLPNLKSLNIADYCPKDPNILGGFKELEGLSFTANSKLDDFSEFKSLKKLKTLLVKGMADPLAQVIPELSALKELKMASLGGLTNTGLEHISKCQSIHSLFIQNSGELNEEGLFALKNLHQLKYFVIGGRNSWLKGTEDTRFPFDDNNLKYLLENCPIESLYLEKCKITKESLELLKSSKDLKALELLDCHLIGSDEISSVEELS